MGLDQKVTWIGTGNVDTMLGSLKTKQVDVLVSSLSLLNDSKEQGWGTLLFDGTDETIWNKYIGGKVPVTSHFTLQSTIDKDPPKMQAFVTAIWRATQWIKKHSPERNLRHDRALCRQHLARRQYSRDHGAAEGYRL